MERQRRQRRQWGAGSVYQDKSGQWWARLEIGDGAQRRFRRARCATRKEAEQTVAAWQAAAAEGVDVAAGRTTLQRYLSQWIAELEAVEEVKPRTIEFWGIRKSALTALRDGYNIHRNFVLTTPYRRSILRMDSSS